ncbi:uncharacterized protein LOC128682321 [Plodia interpunctella]|uniref:uncharacterized protein LOC128682321 n=1 Tax=Plodia interpunctella TaxID=58824 RepID=UPI0023676AA6|nr:uncharacterized protein LOC128682321 [Plodia interpunctella]
MLLRIVFLLFLISNCFALPFGGFDSISSGIDEGVGLFGKGSKNAGDSLKKTPHDLPDDKHGLDKHPGADDLGTPPGSEKNPGKDFDKILGKDKLPEKDLNPLDTFPGKDNPFNKLPGKDDLLDQIPGKKEIYDPLKKLWDGKHDDPNTPPTDDDVSPPIKATTPSVPSVTPCDDATPSLPTTPSKPTPTTPTVPSTPPCDDKTQSVPTTQTPPTTPAPPCDDDNSPVAVVSKMKPEEKKHLAKFVNYLKDLLGQW